MHHGKLDKATARGLRELRKRIDDANIPSSKLDESINLATWNVRAFGAKPRLKASLHYVAEILGQFDLIAVTEVRDNLSDLNEVLGYLGPYWRTVFSDFIRDAGGNKERIAYVYDKRAVAFTGLAAEADAPRRKDPKTKEYLPRLSWWRSPYISSFRAGSFDFVLITAHIRWGSKKKDRLQPLKLLAEWVDARRKERFGVDKDIIVMGDFNIPKRDDELFRAVTAKHLNIPEPLRGYEHGSNLEKNKRYDQILCHPRFPDLFDKNAGGVLDFYQGDHKPLFPGRRMSKTDFTFQMSDHLPLWAQLNTDAEGMELDQIISPKRAGGSRGRRR
jgi:endonuclease/exonuclease/phosphatase family metal-dependent hydrolase